MPRTDIDLTVPDLFGKRAVLTGGSDGIGLGIAKRLPSGAAKGRAAHTQSSAAT